MKLSRKVELQLTPMQLEVLLKSAGCARWAYNWGLMQKQEAWSKRKAALDNGVLQKDAPKVPSAIDLHRDLTRLKKVSKEQGGVPWMYESSKAAPQEALRNLDNAFKHFFRRVKKGEMPGYPKFKTKRKGLGGFRLTGAIKVESKTIRLPRIGWVRVKPGDHGYLPVGNPSQVSVSECAGRWFISVLEPEEVEGLPNGGSSVGVDLGVARLATLSDGEVIENPRVFKQEERKLKRRQKSLSRKQKGSANRRKARQALARTHFRIANLRKDVLHKVTTGLTKSHGRIVIEDLHVKNMTQRRSGKGKAAKSGLNRAILDAGFGEFRRMLEYKGQLYGCEVVAVSPQYTSQRCSACGFVDAKNRPTQERFKCLSCGHEENADINAAKNILVAGSCPETQNACGDDVRPSRIGQLSVKQESASVRTDYVSSNGAMIPKDCVEV